MKRTWPWLVTMILLGVAEACEANHDWGGIDVCTTYRDTAPPGIDPATLPEPHSRGAQLLQKYCTQCHELTGPGRHTAEEWPAVLERMRMLMDVSRRFRGLMGSIRLPEAHELDMLADYLSRHALRPMRAAPRGPGAQAFVAGCTACHALPDPRLYRAADWPGIVAIMRNKASIMGRADLDAALATQELLAFLQHNAADRTPADYDNNYAVSQATMAPIEGSAQYGLPRRLAWLIPFFAVSGLGMWRWWRGRG